MLNKKKMTEEDSCNKLKQLDQDKNSLMRDIHHSNWSHQKIRHVLSEEELMPKKLLESKLLKMHLMRELLNLLLPLPRNKLN